MKEWWDWLMWYLFERKRKSARIPREFRVPKEYTLQVLELLDKFKTCKETGCVERFHLWNKVTEAIPDLPTGSWVINTDDATTVVIKEIIKDKL